MWKKPVFLKDVFLHGKWELQCIYAAFILFNNAFDMGNTYYLPLSLISLGVLAKQIVQSRSKLIEKIIKLASFSFTYMEYQFLQRVFYLSLCFPLSISH